MMLKMGEVQYLEEIVSLMEMDDMRVGRLWGFALLEVD